MVDFESVLELTAAILAGHPAAAAAVRDRYRYFVVDEYQDVNPLQQLLLDQWAGERDDVCVVGDPRQTIYSFAGATPAYLTRFPLRYPGSHGDQAGPQLPVHAAGGGAGQPGIRSGRAGAGGTAASGPAPELSEYPDEPAEAADVAARAAALIAAGMPPREIAVLVRTNAMTAGFEEALARGRRDVPAARDRAVLRARRGKQAVDLLGWRPGRPRQMNTLPPRSGRC